MQYLLVLSDFPLHFILLNTISPFSRFDFFYINDLLQSDDNLTMYAFFNCSIS
jgi:hypothetical protein